MTRKAFTLVAVILGVIYICVWIRLYRRAHWLSFEGGAEPRLPSALKSFNRRSQEGSVNRQNDDGQGEEPTQALSRNWKNESFSACLLVMDENFRLREWLAYHYHVLPLRNLILATDPRSKQSPKSILDTFRRELGMSITEWTDEDFGFLSTTTTDNATTSGAAPNTTGMSKRWKHLFRQQVFLQKCLEELHRNGHAWTACHDTDEYISINPQARTGQYKDITRNQENDWKEPGGVLRYIRHRKRLEANDTNGNAVVVPSSRDCWMTPRVLIGTTETNQTTRTPELPQQIQEQLDPFFRFDTMRWKHYNKRRENHFNGNGKVLIDASKVGPFIPLSVKSPHRVVAEMCDSIGTLRFSPFQVNHYLGSWEEYSHRDDARKGSDKTIDVSVLYRCARVGVR